MAVRPAGFSCLDGPDTDLDQQPRGRCKGQPRADERHTGGCGKSFVAEALLNATLGRGDIAIAYDSSGCCFRAARRRTDSATAQLLRETKLIIWDGAIKAHRGQIEAVDSSLRETMKKQVRRLKTRPPP